MLKFITFIVVSHLAYYYLIHQLQTTLATYIVKNTTVLHHSDELTVFWVKDRRITLNRFIVTVFKVIEYPNRFIMV